MSSRSRFVLPAILVVVALICARLGVWQLHRLRQRRAANAMALTARNQPVVDLSAGPLPTEVEVALFRVAQEALVNILARAQARNVELLIESEGEGYQMTVGDDGPAMDAAQVRALVGMRHRLMGAGGRLQVEAVPNQGNRIRAYVPRSRAKSE